MGHADVVGVGRIADGIVEVFLADLVLEHRFAHIFFGRALLIDEQLGRLHEAAHELGGNSPVLLVELLAHDERAHGFADRRVVGLHDLHAVTLVNGLRRLRLALHDGVEVLAQQRLIEVGEGQVDYLHVLARLV